MKLLNGVERATTYKITPNSMQKPAQPLKMGKHGFGMSKENIKASLGNPEAVKPVMGTFMNTERWSYYSKRIELYFMDGLVSALVPL